MKQPKESEIQHTILEWLRWQGVYCWKQNTSGIYKHSTGKYIPSGMKGVSDILGILKGGIFLAIEVKRPKHQPTETQQYFLDKITKNGGVAFCAHSIEEVIYNLKDYFL